MRCCADHWAAMRKAVHDKGMSQLVSGSGQELLERTELSFDDANGSAALAKAKEKQSFDPLAGMTWNFYGRVMQSAGLWVMGERPAEPDGMPENDGQYCPLCIVKRDFDAHNTPTGACGDPKCIIRVKPGEPPWDEAWIEGC